jgi:hypothetical protein
MDSRELLEKYNLLLCENSRLMKENERLKVKFGLTNRKPPENRVTESTTETASEPDMKPFCF